MSRCNLCGAVVEAARDVVWQKDGLRIARCPSCSLLFRLEPPSDGELRDIYKFDYFSNASGADVDGYADYLADEQLHRANARRRLALLERHVPKGRMLDVGCAAGFFVAEAVARGWEAEGIDVSEEMTKWGRERLQVPLETRTFAESQPREASLDLVTMWDYIEHTINPTEELAQAYASLRPGGLLGLSTGDSGSFVARLSGRRWHLLTPRHHNYFFSRATIAAYMRKVGFDVVQISYPSSLYSLGHVVYKVRTMLGMTRIKALERQIQALRLRSATLPLNLYDIMLLVARKPR